MKEINLYLQKKTSVGYSAYICIATIVLLWLTGVITFSILFSQYGTNPYKIWLIIFIFPGLVIVIYLLTFTIIPIIIPITHIIDHLLCRCKLCCGK